MIENNRRKEEKHPGFFLILCLVFSLLLSGCRLAKEELQDVKEEEICGVLVTVGEQEAERQREKEQEGKIYNSMKELEKDLWAPTVAEGVRQEDGSYTFEGVQGHMLGIFEEENEEGSYIRFANSGSMADVNASSNVTDEGTSYRMEAKVLAAFGLDEPIYINPVFRRSDGTVYVSLEGSGILIGGVASEGEFWSNTYTYETTERVNGKEETLTKEFTVSIEAVSPVKLIRVKEMNQADEVLSVREISRDTAEVTLQDETAYVIVEEELTDGTLRRSLYDWEPEKAENEGIFHQANYPGEDGLIALENICFIKE